LRQLIAGALYNMVGNMNSPLRVVDAPNAGARFLAAGMQLCVVNRSTSTVVRVIQVNSLVRDPLNNLAFFAARYLTKTFMRTVYTVTRGNVMLSPAQYWTTNPPIRLSLNEDLLVFDPGAIGLGRRFRAIGGGFENISIGRNAHLFQGAGARALTFYLRGKL